MVGLHHLAFGMPRPTSLVCAASRTSSCRCQPRLSRYHFTTATPYQYSENVRDKPSLNSEDFPNERPYDYSWIQDAELALIQGHKNLLPKPSVYILFRQKLDQFEAQIREQIKTNDLLRPEHLQMVHKLREKLDMAEEDNKKRVRLFDSIITETADEHKDMRERLPVWRIHRKSQTAVSEKRSGRGGRGAK
ncbi:hypothetical protein FKW77_000557 [Venturia effusa]|uniref:Uncharacterized protein n=1 Tax=Venturia effusa TaxID=50376 RepID=A0A517L0P7_9PEZI|nr:hypothetical protein FKW77_000557 [Venturia effusa]